jgi:hypothetical protein
MDGECRVLLAPGNGVARKVASSVESTRLEGLLDRIFGARRNPELALTTVRRVPFDRGAGMVEG